MNSDPHPTHRRRCVGHSLTARGYKKDPGFFASLWNDTKTSGQSEESDAVALYVEEVPVHAAGIRGTSTPQTPVGMTQEKSTALVAPSATLLSSFTVLTGARSTRCARSGQAPRRILFFFLQTGSPRPAGGFGSLGWVFSLSTDCSVIALTIADCLYNLRSCLDHLARALALNEQGSLSDDDLFENAVRFTATPCQEILFENLEVMVCRV